ncbi:hypothetical protein K435DRAFT_853557 [Dendrothele bispora CBS 962.96]|uniref:Uncharacterized protein n=1 Tax=Dendrothele bispora (strain CBS 962.96) TaxID=1314807 RepID=A0A4V4HH76_DENBC|nr:hypothetical protein K435DRAFT_853557 [Dendrothele bispora CBS 962.96]
MLSRQGKLRVSGWEVIVCCVGKLGFTRFWYVFFVDLEVDRAISTILRDPQPSSFLALFPTLSLFYPNLSLFYLTLTLFYSNPRPLLFQPSPSSIPPPFPFCFTPPSPLSLPSLLYPALSFLYP